MQIRWAQFFPCSRFEHSCPQTAMSSKMQSSSSIAQARRTVHQLRIEASFDRIKVPFFFFYIQSFTWLDCSTPTPCMSREITLVDWFLCRCPRLHRTWCATVQNTPRMTRCSWASPLPKTLSRTRSLALFCRGTPELLLLSFSFLYGGEIKKTDRNIVHSLS